jgi:phage portal protein BeeE
MDRMQFREAMAANLVLRGNTYALKELAATGNVSSLYPIPSQQRHAERDRDTGERALSSWIAAGARSIRRERSGTFRQFGFNGLVGLSPLGYGRHAIALAAAAEEFGSRFFGNGARASGRSRSRNGSRTISAPKRKRTSRRFYGGLDNAHQDQAPRGRHGVFERSAPSRTRRSITSCAAFQIPDICRFFGVPPHLAFDLERAAITTSRRSPANSSCSASCRISSGFETAAQHQLLKPRRSPQVFRPLQFRGAAPREFARARAVLLAMLQNGVLSRNEVREKENLNRINEAGMDDRTVQTNLALIQFLEAMVKAGAETGRNNNPQPGAGA